MKDWIKENILQSRTAWAAILALVVGVVLWLIFVPKSLEAWVALGTFLTLVFGGWTTINKIGDAQK